MTTATERFKAMLANFAERVCILEEQLEQAHARIAELEAEPVSQRKESWNGLAVRS